MVIHVVELFFKPSFKNRREILLCECTIFLLYELCHVLLIVMLMNTIPDVEDNLGTFSKEQIFLYFAILCMAYETLHHTTLFFSVFREARRSISSDFYYASNFLLSFGSDNNYFIQKNCALPNVTFQTIFHVFNLITIYTLLLMMIPVLLTYDNKRDFDATLLPFLILGFSGMCLCL